MTADQDGMERENAPGLEEDWRARFDRFAARDAADWTISGWSKHGLLRRMAAVARAFRRTPPAAGGLVLDVGCGPGLYVEWLAERGFKAFGLDYSLGMLGRARRVLGMGRVGFAAADVYHLPCRDAASEATIIIGVLQHLSDAPRAVGELARVTAPGGRLFLDTLNRWSVQGMIASLRDRIRGRIKGRRGRHAVRYRPVRLARVIRQGGFAEVRVTGVYILPIWLRFMEPVFDVLDSVLRPPRCPIPLTLPFANAFLVSARRG